MNKAHVWRAALNRLRRDLTSAQVNAWLSGAHLAEVSTGAATLHVRSSYEKQLLETRYREMIEHALTETLGAPVALSIMVGSGVSRHPARAAEKSQAAYTAPLFAVDDAADAPTRPAPRLVPAPVQSAPVVTRSAPQPVESERAGAPASRAIAVRASLPGAVRDGARAVPTIPEGPSGERDTRASGIWRDDPPPRVGEKATMNEPGDDGMDFDEADEPSVEPRGAAPDARPRPAPPASSGGSAPLAPPRLNQRYTFSTFIVGSGNQLAHAASLAVADAPGHAYNPLFLYGGVGLGKTHLLHAIGHTALERGLTVLYVSSETFTNEIVDAIRYRTTEEFRAKYRSVDVLLVDDIQFIAGKDSTEEEFFHTFNSLYETNRQIVICSDRPPKAIVSLEERLRSRFEWGLIADIQPPDLEMRIAILRAKADLLPQRIPDEIILYLASRVQSNIRELEGSLNRVQAYAQLQGLPLTLDTAKAAMVSLASDTRQRRVSIEDILSAVAEHYHIPADDLRGKQRDKQIVVPRHVAMYLMRQETEASLLEIGQALGGRDHSTVLHGCEKIGREINENTALRKEVLAIRQQLAE
ncbi:MAG TPA: chromosomal replication initiator protein DnaA [Ktedonobacterales bacterium]|nr:chromosomal replication initiator protein DnaA [Ktedonobacterales bacterium]